MKVHVNIKVYDSLHTQKYGVSAMQMVVSQILGAYGHELVDLPEADLVISDDATLTLKALKLNKDATQFVMSADQAATGLLSSDFADRVKIFAPSKEKDAPFWVDEFAQYLLTLKNQPITEEVK
jgi:hypothetical protein